MSVDEIVFYHNPRCSKSREALQLLHARSIEPTIVLYLQTPPDAAALKTLLKKLGIPARKLLRSGEAIYRELGLADTSIDEERIIDAMVEHPILIERPIAIRGEKAVIGRPPETVLSLFDR